MQDGPEQAVTIYVLDLVHETEMALLYLGLLVELSRFDRLCRAQDAAKGVSDG